jgi:hypothetical protein
MIRYNVRNTASGQITNTWLSSFADATYYEPCFGKPDRWVAEDAGGNIIGEDASQADDIREVEGDGGQTITEHHFEAEYAIEQSDVGAQLQLDQATNQAMINQSTGAFVVARVAAINESKLAAQTMSQQTFNALLADQNVANIERLLWNGSLITAKALIQSVNLSAYYTSDEIAGILALLP